jgi:hypothetical protein
MTRLPSSRHIMHRGLRLPGLRAGDDSPLRTSLRRAVRGTCRSRRLSTPRRRRCGPNAMFPTRSPPCAGASPTLSSNDYHDARAVKHQCQHAHNGEICDTVKLGRADPWLIAKARVLGATVVTHELLRPPETIRKVAIPNICTEFKVPYQNTFDLLRGLGFFRTQRMRRGDMLLSSLMLDLGPDLLLHQIHQHRHHREIDHHREAGTLPLLHLGLGRPGEEG